MDITGLGSAFDLAKGIIDRIWPNKNDPAYVAAQAQLVQAQTAGALKELDDSFQLLKAQADANTAEAGKGVTFRDGAGWTCVAGFAVSLLKPVIEWACTLAGHPITLPSIDTTTSTTMLTALLGLGGLHMYEKVKS
jgi:hypothetical protein